MRVPVSWLQEFFESPLPAVSGVVDLLDGLGLAVERVIPLAAAPDDVIVVRVETVAPIRGSDHLQLAVVTDGSRESRVACGAPNVRPGMLTALALPGATLPIGEGMVVGEREIMGVTSEGMLCSPKELGLYEHTAGLIEFGDDAPVGGKLSELWESEDVIELELTPNRADAFSLLGVARDLAAKLGVPHRDPTAGLDAGVVNGAGALRIDVQDPACTRFTLRPVDGVRVVPSPIWLQRRLAGVGLRPRNAIVDVTNFVTFELGQPSHAYDLDTLGDGTIQVRRAAEGETLDILNGDTLELHGEDLLIATPGDAGESIPIGLAGVMGGTHDSVSGTTTRVAVEVANFEPVVVRRSGQRHKLVTDARTRFERGVDPNVQKAASARVCSLIAELTGGRVGPVVAVVGDDVNRPAVPYRPSRVEFLMDFGVEPAVQRDYLERLGCVVEVVGDDAWSVTPPSWRYDMAYEEDFVEEVGRLHGYEHIGQTVPNMHFVPATDDATHRQLRHALASLGLQETISYVFTGDAELAASKAPPAAVRLLEPQGIERSVLRTALYPGLVGAAAANRHRASLGLFEVGRVFGATEEERVALLLRGPRLTNGWGTSTPGDFFALKGLLESVAGTLGADFTVRPATEGEAAHLHPGIAGVAVWNGEEVGVIGRLHPEVEAAYELHDVYVAELDLPLRGKRVTFGDLNRQPFAERDLAVVVPSATTYAELADLVRSAAGELLARLEPFDVYEGKGVPDGHRSVALRFGFQAAGRALTDDEVDVLMAKVMAAAREAGYDIRA